MKYSIVTRCVMTYSSTPRPGHLSNNGSRPDPYTLNVGPRPNMANLPHLRERLQTYRTSGSGCKPTAPPGSGC
uniref:Uncharacterized protein n=1 Tax=Tanacetum cinerariifolium TaxID=118510 RepID=A0A699SQD1_TANCI|nr:hypothetical protein [Tanacetum cinerariifolium]